MNSTLPFICGSMLTAMVAAGISHHWSVQSIVALAPRTHEAVLVQSVLPSIHKPKREASEPIATVIETPEIDQHSPTQEQFFSELLTELKQLKSENQNLRELMGETNRDVMKLAFRVDTHSESFRPLPITEERNDTTFNFGEDSLPGVLPPRAKPVFKQGE